MSDGGHAFPVSTIDGFTQHGMSLRDWFAGQALAMPAPSSWRGSPVGAKMFGTTADDIAFRSYAIADAMIAARATGDTQ